MDIANVLDMQREFFNSGNTRYTEYRLNALRKLKANIKRMEGDILAALYADLSKAGMEAYITEVGIVYDEINYMLKNTRRLSKPRYKLSPLSHMPSRLVEYKEPYGNVLIISPWNFPFLLTISPLVDALAAGNTALVKPSAKAAHTKNIMQKLIENTFPPEYVYFVSGGREQNANLLDYHYDYIFFTGSKNFGKQVMKKAAEHLTPVTLELGGKSPCIIDKNCNMDLAVKRSMFGKLTNAGQVCVAPDYFLVHEDIAEEFISKCKARIQEIYTDDPLTCDYYPNIISKQEFDRILSLIDVEKTVFGGKSYANSLKIEPTLLYPVNLQDACMSMEIFGPIIPVIPYNNHEENLNIIAKNPTPLALYIFTEDKKIADYYIKNVRFGGGCINDTLMHVGTNKIGFGGVGQSGMGLYHGKYGFDTFTHTKGMVDTSTRFDMPVRYLPPSKWKKSILKRVLK